MCFVPGQPCSHEAKENKAPEIDVNHPTFFDSQQKGSVPKPDGIDAMQSHKKGACIILLLNF